MQTDILNNPEISLKAKGLYCFMFSECDGTMLTADAMAKKSKDSRDSVLSAIKELKDHGLVDYIKKSNGRGVYMRRENK